MDPVTASMVSNVVLALAVSALFLLILYTLLRPRPAKEPLLPYDRDSQPWVLIVRPDSDKDDPLVITAKRIAYQYQVPFQEVPPEQSPLPLPSHMKAIVFQGRYLWFTTNTFDKEQYVRSLIAARTHWENYLASYRRSLSRTVTIIHPGIYATHGTDFADAYPASAFVDSDDIYISEDGSIEPSAVGLPYHPYMEEGLRMFGAQIRDLRNLSPVRENVYVVRPKTVEEQL